MKNKKIALVGVHGTGKSKICKQIKSKLYENFFAKETLKINKDSDYGPTEIYYSFYNKFAHIPEQFREVLKDLNHFNQKDKMVNQAEEITLATYAKQLYLENLYTAQGKNILCDRSVLDTFVYYGYCAKRDYIIETMGDLKWATLENTIAIPSLTCAFLSAVNSMSSYDKIYLIEPSDREIENDGFRLTDKNEQLEIHKLLLKYFKDFESVEIINQDDANKEEFIERIANEFIL